MSVPGMASAQVLLRVGLGHAEGVRALIRELGLDELAAERAWAAAVPTVENTEPRRAALLGAV